MMLRKGLLALIGLVFSVPAFAQNYYPRIVYPIGISNAAPSLPLVETSRSTLPQTRIARSPFSQSTAETFKPKAATSSPQSVRNDSRQETDSTQSTRLRSLPATEIRPLPIMGDHKSWLASDLRSLPSLDLAKSDRTGYINSKAIRLNRLPALNEESTDKPFENPMRLLVRRIPKQASK